MRSRMTALPWLSVILCTYNGARFIRATLESVRAQGELGDIEILAIDDGSTDGTADILAEYAATLPLRVLPHTRTGNWVANTNRGLEAARGRFVSLLHQDDTWFAGRLDHLRVACSTHPQCGFLLSASRYIDSAGRTVGRWTLPVACHDGPVDASVVLERLVVQNQIAIPAPIFARTLLSPTGRLREELWFLADWEFWGRLIAQTTPYYIATPLVTFRIHGGSQTSTRSHDAADLRAQYRAASESICSVIPVPSKHLRKARQAARMNAEVSIALAMLSHSQRPALLPMARCAWGMGPRAWWRFLRDSRLHQRVPSRLRARLSG